MERVAHYALAVALLCFFLSPLVPIHYFPWNSFYSEFVAGLGLVCLILFSILMRRTFLLTAPVFVLMALSLVPLVQYTGGVIYFLGDALLAFAYLTGLALAMAMGQQLFTVYREQFVIIVAFFLLGLTIVCTYQALYQWLKLYYLGMWVVDVAPDLRATANLAQPNNLATLLCLGIFSVLYLWEKKKLTASSGIFISLFLLMGVVLTQSRTTWLIALVFFIWWLWKHNVISLRLTWPVVISVPAIYILLRAGLQSFHELLLLNQPFREIKTAMDAREAIWSELVQAVIDGPLWGYGWGQVAVAQATVKSANDAVVYTEHSHNLFLDLLIWNGPLLGAVCIVLILYWGLKQGWIAASKEQWFLLLIIATVMLHGMLEYPIEYGYFLFPIGLMIGALIKPSDWSISVSPVWQGLVFIVAMVFISAIFREYRILEEDNRKLRFESVLVDEVRIPGFAPDVMLLTQLQAFQRFARTEAHDHMTAEEIEWMRQVTYRFPIPPMLMRYTLATGLNGNPEEASLTLAKIHRLHGDELFEEAKASIILMANSRYPQLKAIKM